MDETSAATSSVALCPRGSGQEAVPPSQQEFECSVHTTVLQVTAVCGCPRKCLRPLMHCPGTPNVNAHHVRSQHDAATYSSSTSCYTTV